MKNLVKYNQLFDKLKVFLRVTSSNGDRIEKTKSRTGIRIGMMTWWSANSHSIRKLQIKGISFEFLNNNCV
jgi:hypothetical protein